jgi:hypothetical protein
MGSRSGAATVAIVAARTTWQQPDRDGGPQAAAGVRGAKQMYPYEIFVKVLMDDRRREADSARQRLAVARTARSRRWRLRGQRAALRPRPA